MERFVAELVVWTTMALLPAGLVAWGVYLLVLQPVGRVERARFFLDLLQTAQDSGKGLERGILEAGRCRDRDPGMRFHLLAGYLERGLTLPQALATVPRLLPPAVAGMLQAGFTVGRVDRVLPMCREWLAEEGRRRRGELSYALVVLALIVPVQFVVVRGFQVFVQPKMVEIFSDDFGGSLSSAHRALEMVDTLVYLPFIFWVPLMVVILGYFGGPRVYGWLRLGLEGVADRVAMLLPWRRDRMLRDFSGTLALLLDAGLPEGEALLLAGESVGNRVVLERARRARRELAEGKSLVEALAPLDRRGEVRWRLESAVGGKGGLWEALAGWRESLTARTVWQERLATQTLTVLALLANALAVGALAVAMFLMLVACVEAAL